MIDRKYFSLDCFSCSELITFYYRPGNDIKFLTEMPSGIKVFVDRGVDAGFLRANLADLNKFSSVLTEIGKVFDLPAGVTHIYYDENGQTIAFNLDGSLFFNFRYYRELHAQGKLTDALVYWFVVACHELGHNIIKDHSSDHSFYTESFVQMYFPAIMEKVVNAQGGTLQPPPSYNPSPSPSPLKN